MSSERIKELEEQIAELKRRWPAHSVPPTMLQQLDDLEAELERALADDIRMKKAGEEESSARSDRDGGPQEMPT
jgi:hypothetical protein